MPGNVQILSTGSYVPERVVTNAEVDALMGESTSQWLIDNVGIRERHWMAPDQVTSDLIVEASKKAIERAGIFASDLDLIIVSTDTPDYLSPSTSVVVQAKLGAEKAGCYDVNSACAGWVTALDQGARYLMTEPTMKYILVAGGYGMSRYLDFKDKKTANLFADGAGAVILGTGDEPGFLASNFLAVGSFHDALGIYSGGTYRPSTPENVEQFGAPNVEFVRKFPKTFNTEYWPKLMQGALDKAGLTFDDVDHYFFTQLNLRTIEYMMDLLKQPIEKTHWVMDKWGYTGSPCVAMALDDAIAQGKGPKPGEVILFCASGGGITMAASVWKWTRLWPVCGVQWVEGVAMTETVRSYRELKVWQKGIDLVKMVYSLTRSFPKSEIYGLTNQMQRAAVSIPSNIAEGQGRQHTAEFRQFLHVALGSAAELDTQLVVALELGYVTAENAQPIFDLILEIRKMTYALLNKLPH